MSALSTSYPWARAAVAAALVLSTLGAQAAGTPISGRGTWETTLQGRELDGNTANGFEAFYDTVLDITWLADANYANTIGYISPTFGVGGGFLTIDEGLALARNLNIGGVTGWRAPQLKDTGLPGCEKLANGGTDCGYNVDPSTSEIVHLFTVTLGNNSVIAPDGTRRTDFGVKNSGPFKNIQTIPGYGLGTPYAPDASQIWAFNPSSGIQVNLSRNSGGFGWAVHDGDVGNVPEPQTVAMMLLGLAGIGAVVRRQRR